MDEEFSEKNRVILSKDILKRGKRHVLDIKLTTKEFSLQHKKDCCVKSFLFPLSFALKFAIHKFLLQKAVDFSIR